MFHANKVYTNSLNNTKNECTMILGHLSSINVIYLGSYVSFLTQGGFKKKRVALSFPMI